MVCFGVGRGLGLSASGYERRPECQSLDEIKSMAAFVRVSICVSLPSLNRVGS